MTVIINFDIGASFYLDHYGIEYIFLNQKYNNNFKDINHNYSYFVKFKKEVKNIHIDGSIDYLYLNKT
jgi:hypothetical protein